jgi:DUF4097 and DUF4098 domain-containing protein YvlB
MRLSGIFLAAMMALSGFSGCMVGAFSSMEGRFERSLNVTGPVEMDVVTGSGAIDVRAGSPGTVRILGVIKANDDMRARAEEKVRYVEANPPIEVNGNTIRIGHINNPDYRNNVSISYEIQVPPDTRLAASTGSGSIRIEGLRRAVDTSTGSGSITIANIEGDVRAKTGSGGIELRSLAGRADLQTGSGSIKGDAIAGSIRAGTGSGQIALGLTTAEQGPPLDVEAQTGSGGIEVSGVYGSLKASTGSGSIRVGGNPIREWTVNTSSGGITLEMAPNAAFDLHAKASSGHLQLDLPVEVRGKVGRNELQGKVRGGGSLVQVHTGSGNITIR